MNAVRASLTIIMRTCFHLPFIYSLLLIFPLAVTVQYEREQYSAEEDYGPVTLALVLDKAVPFPVAVIVSTLDLLNSSVGDAATGELMQLGLKLPT